MKGTKDSRSQRFLFPDVTESMIRLIIASPWICLVGDILLYALYHGSHHHFSPPFLSKKFFWSLSSKHRRVANRRLFLYDWPMEEGLWNARPLSSLRPLADGWESSEQSEVGLGSYKVGQKNSTSRVNNNSVYPYMTIYRGYNSITSRGPSCIVLEVPKCQIVGVISGQNYSDLFPPQKWVVKRIREVSHKSP